MLKKSIFTFIFTLALVTSVVTNASAASSVQEGIYFSKTKEFFTTQQLNQLPFTKIGELFAKNSPSDVYIYFKGIGTASLQQANNSSFIDAANKNGNPNNPENIIPDGQYKDQNSNDINIGDSSSTDGDFEVLSIS